MSNAMRFGKRSLAGVAAAALALGTLSIAGATSASAKPSIKPKATVAATVNAVRATGLGGTSPLDLPSASMIWTGASSISTGSTVDLTAAPTASAKLYYNADDTVTLNTTDTAGAAATTDSNDDSVFTFRVDTAGVYAGMIFNGTDTVNFSFSTAGAPTSMTLTPATQTVLVGGTADFTVSLFDSTGKPTQPQTVDSVALTRSPTDDTLVPAGELSPAITGLSAASLATGSGEFSLSTSLTTAGTTTVTASPGGTLAATGVTAQTATVIKSGTVASNSVSKFTVTSPTNAFNSNATVASSTAQVPLPTQKVTVTIDDTTVAAAGNTLRFGVYADVAGATINGAATGTTLADAVFIDVATNSSKQASLELALGGTALNLNAQITVTQVNVRDIATSVPAGASLAITQTQAVVQGANIVPTPTNALAKLGATTTVTVQVDDSFGVDQPGWTVRAYRTSTSGTLLSTATTNASGQATVTVSPVSTLTTGQSETYVYTATAPVGGSPINGAVSTTVIYTTDGNISSMTVTPASGNAFSNTTPTVTTAPVIFVPDDTAGVVYGQSSGSVTISTGVNAVEPTGMYTAFTPAPNLATAVTATVSEASGLRVSATVPGATTLWSGGATSATLTGNGSNKFYVWGTKTGTHDIVFSSGGITLTGKVKVSNRAQDAYNISITPDKVNVAKGGFTTLTAKVTDFWGNPVATTTGAVTATATGEVLLGGQNNTATFTTGAAGTASISVIAANTTGVGTVSLTPTTAGAPPAWAAGYTKPTSFTAAPVVSAASVITVGEAPVTKSITITGSRATVSGKPGIKIEGVTVGIEDGKTVIPYFRFPGETSYTQGSARPVVQGDEFTWQRKTGKKFYAYVTNDDGSVQSNRVIIPAQ